MKFNQHAFSQSHNCFLGLFAVTFLISICTVTRAQEGFFVASLIDESPDSFQVMALVDGIKTKTTIFTELGAEVDKVTFNSDGSKAFAVLKDGRVRVYDSTDGRCLSSTRSRSNRFHTVCPLGFRPEHRYCVLGRNDSAGFNTIQFWDMKTEQNVRMFANLRMEGDFAISPNGRKIVVGSYLDEATVFDALNGELLCTLKDNQVENDAIGYSWPGADISVDVRSSDEVDSDFDEDSWDEGPEEARDRDEAFADLPFSLDEISLNEQVYSLSFSPDGKKIVEVSMLDGARVYDAKNDNRLYTLGETRQYFEVYAAAFSDDNLRIAAILHDGTINIYDAQNGDFLHSLSGKVVHNGAPCALAFVHSGDFIAMSLGKKISFWSTTTGNLKGTAEYPGEVLAMIWADGSDKNPPIYSEELEEGAECFQLMDNGESGNRLETPPEQEIILPYKHIEITNLIKNRKVLEILGVGDDVDTIRDSATLPRKIIMASKYFRLLMDRRFKDSQTGNRLTFYLPGDLELVPIDIIKKLLVINYRIKKSKRDRATSRTEKDFEAVDQYFHTTKEMIGDLTTELLEFLEKNLELGNCEEDIFYKLATFMDLRDLLEGVNLRSMGALLVGLLSRRPYYDTLWQNQSIHAAQHGVLPYYRKVITEAEGVKLEDFIKEKEFLLARNDKAAWIAHVYALFVTMNVHLSLGFKLASLAAKDAILGATRSALTDKFPLRFIGYLRLIFSREELARNDRLTPIFREAEAQYNATNSVLPRTADAVLKAVFTRHSSRSGIYGGSANRHHAKNVARREIERLGLSEMSEVAPLSYVVTKKTIALDLLRNTDYFWNKTYQSAIRSMKVRAFQKQIFNNRANFHAFWAKKFGSIFGRRYSYSDLMERDDTRHSLINWKKHFHRISSIIEAMGEHT